MEIDTERNDVELRGSRAHAKILHEGSNEHDEWCAKIDQ